MSSARVPSSVSTRSISAAIACSFVGSKSNAASPAYLGNRPGPRRDDRDARGHRLQHRKAEALIDRRVREY